MIKVESQVFCDGAQAGEPCSDKSTSLAMLCYMPNGQLVIEWPPSQAPWAVTPPLGIRCPICNAKAFQRARGRIGG